MPTPRMHSPLARVKAIPPLDPPFDDEYPALTAGPDTAGSPAGPPGQATDRTGHGFRDQPGPDGSPEHPRPVGYRDRSTVPRPRTGERQRPVRRPLPGPRPPGAGISGTTVPGVSATGGTVPGVSDDARRTANRFLGLCLEIINGYRPIAHAHRLAARGGGETLGAQLADAAARLVGPVPTVRAGRPGPSVRLRRVRVCEPRTGVVEAAAVVQATGRTWAMAFRLERRNGNWVGIEIHLV